MYPFDKYYINTNIIASAWITGLTNMNQVGGKGAIMYAY